MSFALDANVLLYASDESSPVHEKARTFLRESATGGETLLLPWPVLMAYVRVATHPTALPRPLTVERAHENVRALLDRPRCRAIAELDGFWQAYESVTSETPARGNLVPDAHVATILRQHGVRRFYTRDRDFRRFAFLDVRDPLAR